MSRTLKTPLSAFLCAFALSISWSAPNAPVASTAFIDSDEGTWMNIDVSPDGQTLVFDFIGDIFRVAREGGDATAIFSGSAYETQPKISPDGRRIAFISDRSGADNVWLADLNGGNARQLTDESYRKPSGPDWSPDGQWIVVRRHMTEARSVGAGELWMYPVSGGEPRRLVERSSTQKDINEPAFSPDGRRLFFSRDSWPGAAFEYDRSPHQGIISIDEVDLASEQVRTLIAGPGGAVRPTPSPDGRHLAYVTRKGVDADGYPSALVVMTFADERKRVVASRLDQDGQELWANHGYYPAFAWTPDSRALIFWARGRIWEQPLDGSEPRNIPFRVRQSWPLTPPPAPTRTRITDRFEVKALDGLAVAPRGDQLAFRALGRIHVRRMGAVPVRTLTSDATELQLDPAFSPDGEWIVYASWNDRTLGQVRRTHIKSGETITLTPDAGHYRNPAVSPDGKTVVFRSVGPGPLLDPRSIREPGIYRASWNGGQIERLADDASGLHWCERAGPLATLERPREDKPPEDAWIPDRVLTDLGQQPSRALAVAPFATAIRVSPDCSWIAYSDRGTIRVARAAWPSAADAEPQLMDAARDLIAPGDGGDFPAWSADGTLHWLLGPRLASWRFDEQGPVGRPVLQDVGFAVTTPGASREAIALINGRFVTMRGDEIIDAGTLLVRGNRIAALGPTADIEIPSGVRRVDLAGRTVIPGLIDNHWHGAVAEHGIVPRRNWKLRATLALGVTTIFDPAPGYSIFAAAELARAGSVLAPRIFGTGPTLYGALGDYSALIEGEADARREVRRRKAWGAIAVKSYLLPRREQRQWVVAAARQEGLFVASEAAMATLATISQLTDGETSIEHAISLPNVYDDVMQLWRQSRNDTVPTMVIGLGGASGELLFYGEEDVWRHPILAHHVPPLELRAGSMRRPRLARADLSVLRSARWLERLRRAGVRVLPGSHGQREGLGLHWEMWLLAEGGAPAHEILRSATLRSAEHLGLDTDLGSLEVGKLADLVVLDADPLRDIRNTDRIRYVMLDGRLRDPITLEPPGGAATPYFWQDAGS